MRYARLGIMIGGGGGLRMAAAAPMSEQSTCVTHVAVSQSLRAHLSEFANVYLYFIPTLTKYVQYSKHILRTRVSSAGGLTN